MSSPKAEDLSSVLDYMSNTISQHVIYQSEHYPNVIALWAVGSYLMDHWSRFPKLLIVSPERECGKTTALETIEAFVCNGKMASSITPAAIYRYLQKACPTLLIDEADLIMKNNEELQAIVNAGHSRRGAIKILSVKTKSGEWEAKEMSLWCPQVIAGIGEFGDTLTSRSILIGLRRKGINELIIDLDDTYFEANASYRNWLSGWSESLARDELSVVPDVPDGIGNRIRDNWLPLLKIAALAGGDWIEKANAAIQELEIKHKAESSKIGISDLLLDLREILINFSGPEIRSSELLKQLLHNSESNWNTANQGRAINSKWLAKQLRPYSIAPRRRSNANVYLLSDLHDAFKRYLPPV